MKSLTKLQLRAKLVWSSMFAARRLMYVSKRDLLRLQNTPGFVPVCQYVWHPHPNEVGCIGEIRIILGQLERYTLP